LDGAGLMIGKQRPEMQFPSATSFGLYSVLHNTSSQARQVTLSLTLAGSGAPETHGLGPITLAPSETKQVNYQDLFAAAKFFPPDGSVDLSVAYVGHDGDVEVEEGSVDQTGNYVFQVIPEPEEWTISRTLCHWYVLRDTNTMISLWNYSAQSEDLVLTLYYTGGKYLLPVHLEPRSDYELDLATLIHSGLPDSRGTVIPQSITEGSAILADAKDELNKIFVALNAGVFNVRTATCNNQCQTCNGVQTLAITPNPISVAPGSTLQLFGVETMNTGSVSEVTSGSWSSTSGSASVNSNGLLTGTGNGTTTVNLTETNLPAPAGYICTGPNGGCPPSVNLLASASSDIGPTPTSVVVGYDPGNAQTNNCPIIAQNSVLRLITYQLKAGSLNAGYYPMQESFGPVSTNTCGNGPPTASGCSATYADGGGEFNDRLATNYCSSQANNSCGFSITPNHFQTCSNGTVKTISSPNYVIHWNSVTINGSVQLNGGTPIP
jgi:hypothetical protein